MNKDIELITQTSDLLIRYGFLAVGLALIILIAPIIYGVSRSKIISVGTVCCGLAFIIAYGILNLISTVWPNLIASQRVLLGGSVLGVPNGKIIQIRSDLRRPGHAYIKREHDPDHQSLFNFPFLLVTPQTPQCLAVAVSGTDPNSEEIQLFSVNNLSSDDMKSNVELFLEHTVTNGNVELKFWREYRDKETDKAETLKPLDANSVGCATMRARRANYISFIGNAFAQNGQLEQTLISNLQSDDAFTRRQARIELAERSTQQTDLLKELIARDDNYRLQLGATVAASLINNKDKALLPPDVTLKLQQLRNNSDKTLKETAALALFTPTCYQEEDTNRQPAGRYLSMCYWSKDQCERVRGPNLRKGISQSNCETINLSGVEWNYSKGGFEGAWFQYSPTPFGAPFPQPEPR